MHFTFYKKHEPRQPRYMCIFQVQKVPVRFDRTHAKNRALIDMRILQMTLDAIKVNHIKRLNSQSF